MKKLILGITGVLLSITLMACGASTSDATLTSLANQLDETSNTISSMQTANPSELVLSNYTTQNEQIYQNARNTQQNLLNEEYYKTDILQETAKIKNCLGKNLKLSKAQISAIKDLTSSLAKYTNSVSYTQSEMKNAIKSVSNMKKNVDKNADKINAKLNKIACNSNARSSYYENILNTLAELENCLDIESMSNTTQNANYAEQNTDTQTESEKSGLVKNIDTYISNDNENTENDTNHTPYYPNTNNLPYANDFVRPPYYFGRYGNVYNRYDRFNPNRNTDTYGPMTRNIDTYGRGNANYGYNGYGNYGNGINNGFYNGFYGYGNGFYNNPEKFYNSNNFNRMNYPAYANTEVEKRLEDFEEVKDDNTVEKIEENEDQSQPATQSNEESQLTAENDKCENTNTLSQKNIETNIDTAPENDTESNEIKDTRNHKIQKIHRTFNAHTRPTSAQQTMAKAEKHRDDDYTFDRHKQIEALSIQ